MKAAPTVRVTAMADRNPGLDSGVKPDHEGEENKAVRCNKETGNSSVAHKIFTGDNKQETNQHIDHWANNSDQPIATRDAKCGNCAASQTHTKNPQKRRCYRARYSS